ncbi:MAG: hypothetical protein ABSG55_02625 [Dehalococcoidia bacterium]|jgi:hypothetical protein
MTGRLIYVTGPSGTGVKTALSKYVRHLRESGIGDADLPRIVCLEDRLKELATEQVQAVLAYRDVTLFRILQLPKPILEDLWLHAFEDALAEAKEARTQGRDALLTFHAIWYHHQNREYISAADFQRLAQDDARADMMVTLIDDVYDVRRRLSEPHGLFENPLDESLSEMEDIVLKLILILDWRAVEQLVSEKIATVTAPPRSHFLLAVKHPISTLQALLAGSIDNPEARHTVYLSHPISDPKSMLHSGRASEASTVIGDIQAIADKLRSGLIVFEPTSIDEARFDHQVTLSDGRTAPFPVLGERWPLAAEERYLLFTPPHGDPANDFGEQWTERAREIRDAARDGRPTSYENELTSSYGLLAILRDAILRHINLRDHKLIDQSNWLVVYRPFFLGRLATGVQEEVMYHDRLVRGGKREQPCLVLHPPADERLRPRETLRSYLVNCLQEGRLSNADDATLNGAVDTADSETLANDDSDLATGLRIRGILDSAGMGFKKARKKSALGKDPASAAEEENEKTGRDFKERLRSYLGDLAPGCIHLEESDLSPLAFADRVVKRVARTAR